MDNTQDPHPVCGRVVGLGVSDDPAAGRALTHFAFMFAGLGLPVRAHRLCLVPGEPCVRCVLISNRASIKAVMVFVLQLTLRRGVIPQVWQAPDSPFRRHALKLYLVNLACAPAPICPRINLRCWR